MKIDPDEYRVRPGEAVDLAQQPTLVATLCKSDKQCAARLQKQVEHLSDLQQLLYAANRQAVLLIFRAMDAAGKDGAIQHVMSGVNPQGCQVFSFKHPSEAELQHDFLWRATRDLPERGRIGIFNRSYYEEVLIVRVHREILRSEGLSDLPTPSGVASSGDQTSGKAATVLSSISSTTCTSTADASSSSSCICRKKSSASASSSASTTRRITGSSAPQTSGSASSGPST